MYVAYTNRARVLRSGLADYLTGWHNRRYLQARLREELARAQRACQPLVCLMIDVDHFKRINDQFGHAKGDSVLKGIVSLVANRSRKLDLLFRIGGEEFMLLLPDTQEVEAAVVAEQLRASVAETPLVDGRQVTVSIGVSELQPGESLDSWIKHGDDALYAAKKAGRNRVVCRGLSSPREIVTLPDAEPEA